MSMPLSRENYFLHKLHSLTGIVPVGFYMVQHLTLNSFTLAGPERFNGVIDFFESIPKHILLTLEITAIWLPLLFHAVYGMFIAGRAKSNYFSEKYKWSQNRMYMLQRASGIVAFLFLLYHIITTTVAKYVSGAHVIKYAAFQEKLTSYGYVFLIVYMIGVLACSYHLCYGIWNFCIRWGITVNEKAQITVQKLSGAMFIALTLLGWAALFGFLIHKPTSSGIVVDKSPSQAQTMAIVAR
ncbi:MAG: hypothetical protein KF784_05470 [Fimbriimonadaceae bacterium]|nr:hypothetical protein [Fimbriimonadaceae bacterium]